MNHHDILKLIEEVDPSDTAKLDEIDILTACWMSRRIWGGWHDEPGGVTGSWGMNKDGAQIPNSYCNHSSFVKYSRDRNELKELRPDVWLINMEPRFFCFQLNDKAGFYAIAVKPLGECIQEDFLNLESPLLKTEELAELHAVIQCIAYERGEA